MAVLRRLLVWGFGSVLLLLLIAVLYLSLVPTPAAGPGDVLERARAVWTSETRGRLLPRPGPAGRPPSDSLLVARMGELLRTKDSLFAALQRRRLQQVIDTLDAALASEQLGLADLERLSRQVTVLRAEHDSLAALLAERAAPAPPPWFSRIAWALLALVLAAVAIRVVIWGIDAFSERNRARSYLYKRWSPAVRLILWLIAFYLIVEGILEISAEGLIAAAAAIGVAVGFAAQDVLKNIFGGLVVILDKPFQVGDKIAVAGTYGEVVGIGLRSTRIQTPDDNLVTVPNAQVVDGQVANANAGALDCQVVTDLYLPGWVDESLAKRLAYQAAASSKFVYLEKPIVVLVKDEFKETFLTHVKVKAYVLDNRYEFLLVSDITERARAAFRAHGLLHPFYGQAGLDIRPPDATPPDATSPNGADTPAPDATA